ncbi:MAG: hypothetical protein Kow00124_18590 [Anaerolineae bacterium]
MRDPARPITRREWVLVLAAGLLILLVLSIPYLIGLWASTPDMTFGGFLFGLEDAHSYVAKMRFGAWSGPLAGLVYTHEPHRAGLLFLFYQAPGRLAALITGQGPAVETATLIVFYHAVRVAAGLALLLMLYRFVADYLDPPGSRLLAWGIAVLGGGLGWALLALDMVRGGGAARLPVDLYIPEAFTLLSLYGIPHLLAARMLLLLGWWLLLRALDDGRWGRAAGAGLAWLGMTAIVPFYGALLGVLIAAWLLALWIAGRRFPGGALRMAALAGALPALALIYYAWLFTTDPVMAAWSAQNRLPSPPVIDYLLAFGPLIAPGLPAAAALLRQRLTPRAALLITWPVTAAVLVYLPINVQRRLLEGVIVPLAILAALGAARLLERHRAVWTAALALLFAALLPSALILLTGGVMAAATPAPPIFHPADELAALDYLRLNAPPGSLVLATHESGNILPAYAPVRVYVGHGPETANSAVKDAIALTFFHGGMDDAARRELLDEIGAAYVWGGPAERPAACAADCFDPAALSLTAVFTRGGYTIYEVGR